MPVYRNVTFEVPARLHFTATATSHFHARVRQALQTIENHRSGVGNMVLNELDRTPPGTVVVWPFLSTALDALTAPVSITLATPAGVRQWNAATGQPLTHTGDDPGTPRIRERAGQPVVGLGGGSGVRIAFNPDTCANTPTQGPGTAADESLLHELVHALRQATGHWATVPMGDNYENQEEFNAILVTNIYSSAVRHATPRRDHIGYQPMAFDPTISMAEVSERFADRYATEIMQLKRQEPSLTTALQNFTGAEFNPLRDYLPVVQQRWDRRERRRRAREADARESIAHGAAAVGRGAYDGMNPGLTGVSHHD
jgi:Effector protein